MFNPHIRFEMSTITCNEVIKDNVKCKNSGFEPSFVDLGGADAWIRHCNATRQQISVYSKLTFACLYPLHLEKWGYRKKFFARSARESCFVPLTFRIAAPPLHPRPHWRSSRRSPDNLVGWGGGHLLPRRHPPRRFDPRACAARFSTWAVPLFETFRRPWTCSIDWCYFRWSWVT